MIENFFHLDIHTKQQIKNLPVLFGYGLFGKIIYYDHYSRNINGQKETWADTVIRIIEGIFSIRKDWHIKTGIRWIESDMQYMARDMAISLQKLKWSPGGRGVWAMGTNLIYARGAMPLYNCAYTNLENIDDLCWMMDALMNGVGVSGGLGHEMYIPGYQNPEVFTYKVPDCREGWTQSVRLLLEHYLEGRPRPHFDYSGLREKGLPLKTFGGTASGPAPLIKLHNRIHDAFANETVSWADLANMIGCCVVAGNIRRSAEMLLGPLDDNFINLKNYEVNSYRQEWGWMSNNTCRLVGPIDFENIEEAFTGGEIPGFANMVNLKKGRLGDYDYVPDVAVGLNPCGEIPLEHREVCNVAETYPTRCLDTGDWLMACKFACFYASTVCLLPTQQPSTNEVIARNRRIGVGIVDYNTWRNIIGQTRTIRALRTGYTCVKYYNKLYANMAGIPVSLRLTTIKPGGTMPKLAGCIGGIGYNESSYLLRRKRVQEGSDLHGRLLDSGLPCEKDFYSDDTVVFEFPVYTGEEYNPGLWEQAMNLVTVQREWADNAVSNTLTYTEDDDIINVVGNILPMVKSLSLLKRSTTDYVQLPEEPITKGEYEKRIAEIRDIDFHSYTEDAVEADRFCSGDKCLVT